MAEQFEELLRQVDIVKVISHYIEVTKSGSNYEAVCPFHNDTRPSLKISPTKQIFNCFVCHNGGNAFHFVQKFEKIPYINAVKKACDICGVKCDLTIKEDQNEIMHRPLLACLEDLCKYYEIYLKTNNGEAGFKYLTDRGISEETIKRFRLGFAPVNPKLSIELLRKNNHSIDDLISAGILSNSTSFNDRFFNRVMFPISDEYGRIRGFSGRVIDGTKDSKYINYPETVLFKKNELLYNSFNAFPLAKKQGYIYIVEGFMDAISLDEVGYPVVASMGTALTDNHITMLKRLKVEVRLLLDSDSAGRNACISSAKNLSRFGVTYKVVKPFIDAKDPDELYHKLGKEGLIAAINELEEPVISFLNLYQSERKLKTYDQKEQFLKEFAVIINSQSTLIKEKLIRDISAQLDFSAESITSFLNELHKGAERSNVQQVVIDEEEVLDLNSLLTKYLKSDNKLYNSDSYQGIVLYESRLIKAITFSRTYYNVFHTQKTVFIGSALNKLLAQIGVIYSTSSVQFIDKGGLDKIISAMNDSSFSSKLGSKIAKVLQITDREDFGSIESFKVYLGNYEKLKRQNSAKMKAKELK